MEKSLQYCDVCGESGHHLVVVSVQGYRLDICHNLAGTRCASKLSFVDVLKLLDSSHSKGMLVRTDVVSSYPAVIPPPTETAVPVPPPPPGPPAEVTPEVTPEPLQLAFSEAPTRTVDLSDLAGYDEDSDDEP